MDHSLLHFVKTLTQHFAYLIYHISYTKTSHRPKHKKECKRQLFDEALFKQPPPNADCVVCLLPMPLFLSRCRFKTCCGNWLCLGCDYGTHLAAGGLTPCPFCRTPSPTTDVETIERCKARMEVGDVGAFYFLGCQYNKGECGLPVDKTKAFELWLHAAGLGFKSAHGVVGKAYLNGIGEFGVEFDLQKALRHLQIASMQGDAESRYILGDLLARSGPDSVPRAKRHFMIAAAAGHDEALKKIAGGYKFGTTTKEEYLTALRAYQSATDSMRSVQRDQVDKAIQGRTTNVHEYFVPPVIDMSKFGCLAEPMESRNAFLKDTSIAKSCGVDPKMLPALHKEPSSTWRPQLGAMSFLGIIDNPQRGMKKLHNPTDFLNFGNNGGKDFDSVCPGHYMSRLEAM